MDQINEMLRMHVEQGTITIQQIAERAMVSGSTAWRWVREGRKMPIDAARKLMTMPRIAADVRSATVEDAPADFDLDFNGDGNIDIDDMLDATAEYHRLVGVDAERTRCETRDGVVTRREHVAMVARANNLNSIKQQISGISAKLADKQPVRRKARPFTAGRVR